MNAGDLHLPPEVEPGHLRRPEPIRRTVMVGEATVSRGTLTGRTATGATQHEKVVKLTVQGRLHDSRMETEELYFTLDQVGPLIDALRAAQHGTDLGTPRAERRRQARAAAKGT